jgi:hypothetical protein
MKPYLLPVVLAGFVVVGCGDQSKPQSTTSQAVSNAVSAPVDYLGAAGAAKNLAEKTVDLAQLNQAIQMFVAQESRYPKSLDELIESKLITQVPKAPYGTKIVYDPATGQVKVVKTP